MPSPSATARLVADPRPTLTLAWSGDYLNDRAHRAYLYRVAAYVEDRARGTNWTVHVDAAASQVSIHLFGGDEKEVQRAMEVLEAVVARVNTAPTGRPGG